MTDNDSEPILNELRRISILLALNLSKDEPQHRQIDLLARLGYQPREIAAYLGTTPNTVSVALAKNKKRRNSADINNEER